MNIRDLLIEEIDLHGEVYVATVGDDGVEMHWSGELYPGVEKDLKTEDGTYPDWFARKEVVTIGSTKDGGLMIAVE